jgi:hypothetical protein
MAITAFDGLYALAVQTTHNLSDGLQIALFRFRRLELPP